MIILIGESGTGKNTVLEELGKKGYTKAINHTTREKRQGEIEGEDYHFVTKAEFEKLWQNNELIQRAEFNGEYYAMHRKYLNDNTAGILIVESIKDIKDRIKKLEITDIHICTVYITVPEEVRVERMRKRGDIEESINTRIRIDREKFKNARDVADVIIENYSLENTVNTILQTC